MNRGINTRKFVVLVLESLAVITACAVLIVINFDKITSYFNKVDSSTSSGLVLQFDPNQTSHKTVSIDKPVAIPGWEYINVSEGSYYADVDLFNPIRNTDSYNMTFSIYLVSSSGNELLYQSKLVSPGNHIYGIKLSTVLSKGDYDAVIHIQPYRISDNSPTNNSDINIKIHVV